MKKGSFFAIFFAVLLSALCASAAEDTQIAVNGKALDFEQPPVVQDGTTLVPIRPIAEELGLVLVWVGGEQTATLWNDDTLVRLKIGSDEMVVNDETRQLSMAPAIINDSTYLPVRAVAEAFGAEVAWVGSTVHIFYGEGLEAAAQFKASLSAASAAQPKVKNDHYFYSQRDGKWGLGDGSGYCWVCSYAMLISNVKGEAVTPADVAAFNSEGGGSGAYMRSHGGIVERFGVRFVQALDSASPYFARYDDWRGATYINASSDADVINALKEALDRNPQGVMVRYEGYPHTMVAVGYEGDTIYYNEPAYTDSEWVTFEETCLKNYELTDISFIQAITK